MDRKIKIRLVYLLMFLALFSPTFYLFKIHDYFKIFMIFTLIGIHLGFYFLWEFKLEK
jgi:hypothetical protein